VLWAGNLVGVAIMTVGYSFILVPDFLGFNINSEEASMELRKQYTGNHTCWHSGNFEIYPARDSCRRYAFTARRVVRHLTPRCPGLVYFEFDESILQAAQVWYLGFFTAAIVSAFFCLVLCCCCCYTLKNDT
jgi:hypothetical protein